MRVFQSVILALLLAAPVAAQPGPPPLLVNPPAAGAPFTLIQAGVGTVPEPTACDAPLRVNPRCLSDAALVVSAPVFNPINVNGLKLWLRPGSATPSLSAYYTDTNCTTPVASDGDAIAGWKDFITGGCFAQSSAGNKPTFKTGIINGWPVGRYAAASSQYLDVSSGTVLDALRNVSGATLFSVILVSDDAVTHRAFAVANNSTAMRIESNNATTQRANIQARALDGDTSSSITSSNNTFTKNAFHVRTDIAAYSAATGSAWIDGTNILNAVSFSSMTAGNTSNTASSAVIVGWNAAHSAGLSWDGDIAEILLFNRVLTTTERQQVQTYLCRKYNVVCSDMMWLAPNVLLLFRRRRRA